MAGFRFPSAFRRTARIPFSTSGLEAARGRESVCRTRASRIGPVTAPARTPAHRAARPARPANSVLREPAFLRVWSVATATSLATWALPFVLGLAVLGRLLSPGALGVLLAARTVGFVVAVPVGGVLADRYPRRRVVLAAALLAAVTTPVLAAGLGRWPVISLLAALLAGAGQGACRPALQALTADTVDEPRRQRANAAMTLATRVTILVAPALAALLATVLDIRLLLTGSGLLWCWALLVPGVVRRAAVGRGSLVGEFADGLREARRHPWFVAGLAALSAVIATGYSATAVVLPLVSRDRYGTELVLAAATTAYTVGALAGALLMARWRPRSAGWVALAGMSGYAVGPVCLLLPVPVVVLIGAYGLAGAGFELFNVPWFTATQREVPPHLLGRVSSLDFTLSYGLSPVGLALIAPAIGAIGAPAVLIGCAVVCLAAPAAAALAPGSRWFGRRAVEPPARSHRRRSSGQAVRAGAGPDDGPGDGPGDARSA